MEAWGKLATSPIMAHEYSVEGWEDGAGERHSGEPSQLDDTFGVLVHAYDPDNPEDQHYFWAFVGGEFDSWDDWWDYIGEMMDMYGMASE